MHHKLQTMECSTRIVSRINGELIDKPKKPGIIVEGNTIDENAFNQLKKLKKGDIVTIGAIQFAVDPYINAMWPNPSFIQIRIDD